MREATLLLQPLPKARRPVMSRRPAARQADVARALKGALAAGLRVLRYEIEGEKITVFTEDRSMNDPDQLDAELKQFEDRHGQS